MPNYRVGQHVFYTGQALSRGVVRAKIANINNPLGLLYLELDGDPHIITDVVSSKYIFPHHMDAVRAAFHDVAQAESSARGVVETYQRKAQGYRAIMDDLFAELYPQSAISAGARVG